MPVSNGGLNLDQAAIPHLSGCSSPHGLGVPRCAALVVLDSSPPWRGLGRSDI